MISFCTAITFKFLMNYFFCFPFVRSFSGSAIGIWFYVPCRLRKGKCKSRKSGQILRNTQNVFCGRLSSDFIGLVRWRYLTAWTGSSFARENQGRWRGRMRNKSCNKVGIKGNMEYKNGCDIVTRHYKRIGRARRIGWLWIYLHKDLQRLQLHEENLIWYPPAYWQVGGI